MTAPTTQAAPTPETLAALVADARTAYLRASLSLAHAGVEFVERDNWAGYQAAEDVQRAAWAEYCAAWIAAHTTGGAP